MSDVDGLMVIRGNGAMPHPVTIYSLDTAWLDLNELANFLDGLQQFVAAERKELDAVRQENRPESAPTTEIDAGAAGWRFPYE